MATPSPQPTAWPSPTRLTARSDAGRLYIVSNVVETVSADGWSATLSGQVTAVDLATRKEIWTIDTSQRPDAVLSPDGTILYVATHVPGELRAVDTRSGVDVWSMPLAYAPDHTLDDGPSSLAVSEDGTRLYVYSYDTAAGEQDERKVPHWVQIFDAATGEHLADTERWTNGCPGQLHSSKYGPTLVLACWGSGRLQLIDLNTNRQLTSVWIGSGIAGSVLGPDGCTLYVVSGGGDVAVVDIEKRQIIDQASLDLEFEDAPYPVISSGLVALSTDGTTLIVGVQITPISSGGTWTAHLLAFDTTNWQPSVAINPEPVFGHSLAVNRTGDVVYGINQVYRGQSNVPELATIVAVGRDGTAPDAPDVYREGEEVLRILIGP